MGTYNNEEQERLSDIALAFSDTTELDNIVSSSPIMKDFSAQSMYNKLTNVEDAMKEDTSELVFDSEGIPFDPNLPRFDIIKMFQGDSPKDTATYGRNT